MILGLLNLLLRYWKYAAVLGLVAVLSTGAWYLHHHWWAQGYAQAVAQVKAHTRVVIKREQIVTTRVVTKLVPVLRVIHERAATIIRRVPVYVTVRDNARCTVNTGFVRLWNDANRLSVPAAPTSVDEAPSAVVLSDIATQHGAEAEICHTDNARFRALQSWVSGEHRVH